MAQSAKYLLDASALYPLILKLKEGLLLYRDRFAILDLTIYEVGNAVWRAYRRGAIKQPVLVARIFEEVLKGLKKLSVGPVLLEVLDIAAKSSVTFYDTSYVYVGFPAAITLNQLPTVLNNCRQLDCLGVPRIGSSFHPLTCEAIGAPRNPKAPHTPFTPFLFPPSLF